MLRFILSRFVLNPWLKKNQGRMEKLVVEAEAELSTLDKRFENIMDTFEKAMGETTTAFAAAEAFGQTRRQEAAKARRERAERKARTPASPERLRTAELDARFKALRPGMPLKALQALVDVSAGAVNLDSLRDDRAWCDGPLSSRSANWSEDGILTRICVSGATDDTAHVAAAGTFDAALASLSGVKVASDLETPERPGVRALQVPSASEAFDIIVWYKKGKLDSTSYWSPEARRAAAAFVAARTQPRAPDIGPFRPAPRDAIFELGEALAQLTPPEADAALRAGLAEMSTPQDQTYAKIGEWLIKDSTPDHRHAMLGFNWDHGFHIPLWIIRQPDTDIATVIRAFWLAEPQSYVSALAAGEAPSNAAAFDFITECGRRLANAGYQPAPGHAPIGYIASAPPPGPAEAEADALLVPSAARSPITGRDPEQIMALPLPEAWYDYLN